MRSSRSRLLGLHRKLTKAEVDAFGDLSKSELISDALALRHAPDPQRWGRMTKPQLLKELALPRYT